MPRHYSQPRRLPVYVIGPSIAYIPLTRGLFALVDAADAEHISRWNWIARPMSHGIYAYRGTKKNGVNKCMSMHRELTQALTPQVDHKNHNTLHNFRANLRPCTGTLNLGNTRIRGDNKTGAKGVFWDSGRQRYQARIRFKGKSMYLGRYSTASEASAVYRRKAAELFGEFALD